MSRENQTLISADHVRVVRVALSTSFTSLKSLVAAALEATLPDKKSIIQINGICSAEWKFREAKNPTSYRTVAANIEKSIPALDAYDLVSVASSSGTPYLELELYLA